MLNPNGFRDPRIADHLNAIAAIMGLDTVRYKVTISFVERDRRPKFQELVR